MSYRGKPFGPRNNSKGYYNVPFRYRPDYDGNRRTILAAESSTGSGSDRVSFRGSYNQPYGGHRYEPIPRGRNRNNRKRGGRQNGPRPVKNNNRDSTGIWFKITIPFGKKLEKDFLLRSLTSLSQEPFYPINFQTVGNAAVFWVDNESASDALRQCSRRITSPEGTKILLHVSSSPPPPTNMNQDDVLEKIKVFMSSRYDGETNNLNLQNFHFDPALKSQGIHAPLVRAHVLNQVVKIIVANIPQLQSLDLSFNKLTNLQGTSMLVTSCKNLKHINLKKNLFHSMSDLNDLKGSNIEEVILDGNPLCDYYKDQASYISDVRSKFPKVIKLDGQDLPPPILFDLGTSETLPDIKGSYFPSADISSNILQFLETYFGIYDSDNRQPLLEAYHEDAVYSLQVAKSSGRPQESKQLNDYIYEYGNRNLTRVNDSTSQEKYLRQGRMAIVTHLCKLPKTQHFPNSINIDVSHLSQTLLMFSVSGLFKEVNYNNSYIKHFTRNFLVVPHDNGIHIINDMHLVAVATPTQMKAHRTANSAVAAAPPPPEPIVSTLPVMTSPMNGAVTEDMKQQLVMQMVSLSRMNIPFSTKCLEEQNWDLQSAMALFTELNNRGGVPPEAFQ